MHFVKIFHESIWTNGVMECNSFFLEWEIVSGGITRKKWLCSVLIFSPKFCPISQHIYCRSSWLKKKTTSSKISRNAFSTRSNLKWRKKRALTDAFYYYIVKTLHIRNLMLFLISIDNRVSLHTWSTKKY